MTNVSNSAFSFPSLDSHKRISLISAKIVGVSFVGKIQRVLVQLVYLFNIVEKASRTEYIILVRSDEIVLQNVKERIGQHINISVNLSLQENGTP